MLVNHAGLRNITADLYSGAARSAGQSVWASYPPLSGTAWSCHPGRVVMLQSSVS